MNPSAVVTFAIIAAFIWGGLAFIVALAFRREAGKRTAALASSQTAAPRTPPATES